MCYSNPDLGLVFICFVAAMDFGLKRSLTEKGMWVGAGETTAAVGELHTLCMLGEGLFPSNCMACSLLCLLVLLAGFCVETVQVGPAARSLRHVSLGQVILEVLESEWQRVSWICLSCWQRVTVTHVRTLALCGGAGCSPSRARRGGLFSPCSGLSCWDQPLVLWLKTESLRHHGDDCSW